MKTTTLTFLLMTLYFNVFSQPTTITWQGKLLDNSGNAITQNNVAMTFAMFDDSTGGNQLWPASGVVTKTVDVVQGLYSLQLGTGVGDDIAFTAAMFAGKTPWLEVKVGVETLPRTEITNVPFALISNELSATGWKSPGEIGKTTPNTGKFTTLETGSLRITTGASDGKVLTADAEGNASWATPYTGLTNFTESNYTYDLRTGVKFTPNNAAVNVDMILQPKGNGALLAQQPDGTDVGGNARGTYAIDLQSTRAFNTQVAGGFRSAVLSGSCNEIRNVSPLFQDGSLSVVVGGQGNIVSGADASIVGGYYNTVSGFRSFIGGGSANVASGGYSSVVGGADNLAAGVRTCVAGGSANSAIGNYSFVGGGIYNTAQSLGESVLGLYATNGTGNASSFVATDRLFTVGNGTADATRSNALTILKNANTTIGGSLTINGNGSSTSYLFPLTRGTSGQVLQTDGSGNTGWITPSSGTVTSVSGTFPIFVGTGSSTPVISISAASTTFAGSMSAADKTKLDGIAANANNYTHPTGDGNLHVPATGTGNNGKVLTAGSAAGSLSWASPSSGTVTSVTGSAPISVATGTTTPAISIAAATTSAAGSMSAADKTKLDAQTTGSAPGQLQYWNGTAWVTIAAGSNGQILKFVNDVPTWTTLKLVDLLSIGDSYQGGIIAYFLQPGDPGYDANVRHGLIAAPSDQSTGIQWYNGSYTTTGATGTAIGTGNANTNTIVTSQGDGSYAAKLCSDLVLGSYSDWYLPSKDELSKLYANRSVIGSFSTGAYWSSSESNSNGAFTYEFSDGETIIYFKHNTKYVRAIRTF